MRRPLVVIFIVVFLDIVAFSLLLPVLTYYATTFGATPTHVGLLGGLYAFCQLFAAPVLSTLSDKYGRKPMFLLDATGSVLGLLLLGFASSFWMIVVSRIISGLVAANIPIAQAYVSDVTQHDERSRGLGVLGAAFGLGFTIGPAIGGILSKQGTREGYALAAFVSAAIAAVNWCVIALFLKESLPPRDRTTAIFSDELRQAFRVFGAGRIKRLTSDNRLITALLYWIGFSLAFATFQQNIALFSQYHLHLTARQTSGVFTYIGISVAISQGLLLRPLTRRFSDVQLLLFSTPLLAVGLAAWAWTPTFAVLMIALAPLCLAGSVLIAVTNSILTQSVAASDVGGITGVAGFIDNGTRVLGAVAGGWLIQHVGTFAPGIIAAVVVLLLSVYAANSLRAAFSTSD